MGLAVNSSKLGWRGDSSCSGRDLGRQCAKSSQEIRVSSKGDSRKGRIQENDEDIWVSNTGTVFSIIALAHR